VEGGEVEGLTVKLTGSEDSNRRDRGEIVRREGQKELQSMIGKPLRG
jgi:hypothetical protein